MTAPRPRPSRARSLLWRLLGINLLVVGVAAGAAALTVGQLANGIFMRLMKDFHIETDPLQRLFVAAMTQSLLAAGAAAAALGLLLSVILFRRVVVRLRGMTRMAERIAAGDYGARIVIPDRDEVGALADSLNRMGEALQRLEDLRKDLVANVAHELRTPLATLRGYLEAMQDGVVAPAPDAIALLHEEVIRLVRLVDALHQLSSFDARVPRPRHERLDVARIAGHLARLRGGEFAAKGVAVELRVTADNAVTGDADLVARALNNLLDNAWKHTPEGGRVTIDVTDEGPGVRFAVANTGSGIAAADLPFVFERFFRGEKSRARDRGGAGIGLAIVREVAAAHAGTVGAESDREQTLVWFGIGTSLPNPDGRFT